MSWTGIEHSPSNIGDKLAWPRVHTTSDPLSYRPPLREHLDENINSSKDIHAQTPMFQPRIGELETEESL